MSLFLNSFTEPFYETPVLAESDLLTIPKSAENDIINAFKENEFTAEDHIILEKIQKTPPFLVKTPESLYIFNDISISNPNLANLIENFLRGIPPNDQELQQLNDVEKDLFNSIRDKKICTDEERNKNILDIKEKKVKKGKRMEESQKLFFKKAYAYLESSFFRDQMKNKKKIQKRHKNYGDFYSHYFADTAKNLDIEIENFYHPHKSFKIKESKTVKTMKNKKGFEKKSIIPGQKSFNKTYIDLILKSKTFKKDLEFYLENHFIKDCAENRHRKILKFLNHCKKIKDDICLMHSITTPNKLDCDGVKKMILLKLRGYILNDGKAKLPWSDTEIIQAYNVCKHLLEY